MQHIPNISESTHRHRIREAHLCDEDKAVSALIDYLSLEKSEREKIVVDAAELVRVLRRARNPGLMETFLGEYGLSTEEGVALMCLAEALLRVPDEATIDILIRDKIAPADWGQHLGHSTSSLVNASTWALMLTGKVITPKETESWDVIGNIRHLIKRAGEPVIRKAVAQSMKILGHQFVLGRDIREAMTRAKAMEEKGYQYSYDMLGEAAQTAADAQAYFLSYSRAISCLSEAATSEDIRNNPGISVKLSALHPRYEYFQKERVMRELVPRVASLVQQAKNARMGFNIDAEEAERLDLSLDVIEAVLSDPDLTGWDGFGIVVQAYGPRAFYVLDWCYDLAKRLDRRIMVRLVKGAYWDTEIKLAQVEGFKNYPVFTRKAATDISYMACARKMFSMTDHIYPQFATHNAHTMTAILTLAGEETNYEFQRLHGMGEALHDLVKDQNNGRCRIYAPVGVHEDLLAYLVRRLLENGANSSFVNQVLDEKVPARDVVRDPIRQLDLQRSKSGFSLSRPADLFPDGRQNSAGMNFSNERELAEILTERAVLADRQWVAGPILNGDLIETGAKPVVNPARHADVVGRVSEASEQDVQTAFENAREALQSWREKPAIERSTALEKIADLYEESRLELMSVLTREAGKSLRDALSEVREAVDFCRFYAKEAVKEDLVHSGQARGVIVCISPWNFPLAIFTGQIAAALVAGNAVMAKPAEQTPVIATLAVKLMHQAGVTPSILQLLPGDGTTVGAALVSHPQTAGVCFTGSTETAWLINRALAETARKDVSLIAETGGLNAMIVDSTALPEQAIRDIIASAFQSTGQRCSALRVLYVQEDVADKLIKMLMGAMDELVIGDPWDPATDVGPVIDHEAQDGILGYCRAMEDEGRLLKKLSLTEDLRNQGSYVEPCLFRLESIAQLEKEIFGPVLHVVTYKSGDVEAVVKEINKTGYGLTMGLHTRVDDRVQKVADLAHVGNLYVNRNQIGAVVGVQPFGGEGKSGTGPKAGGPLYLHKLVGKNKDYSEYSAGMVLADLSEDVPYTGTADSLKEQERWNKVPDRISLFKKNRLTICSAGGFSEQAFTRLLAGYHQESIELPGPTGESNRLQFHGRGVVFVMGVRWKQDAALALATGNAIIVWGKPEGYEPFVECLTQSGIPEALIATVEQSSLRSFIRQATGLSAACLSVDYETCKTIQAWLAFRSGPLVPVLQGDKGWREFVHERTLSIDTTASGGNAALLAAVEA